MRWVTWVSLSDWLVFQARIRESEAPLLLRDRSLDGAALARRVDGWRFVRRCGGLDIE